MKIFMKKLFGVLVFFSSFFIGYQFWCEALVLTVPLKDKISTELGWCVIALISILSIILIFYIMNLGMKIIDSANKNKQILYPYYPYLIDERYVRYLRKRRSDDDDDFSLVYGGYSPYFSYDKLTNHDYD